MDWRQKDQKVHPEKTSRTLGFFVLCLAVLFFTACAGGVNYRTLDDMVRARNCPAASKYVEEKEGKYGPNRRLLFFMDAASVNMLCGAYEKSNSFLHKADETAEELWTKSITKHAASFIVNDYTIPYAGEDFERALINLFSAINYAVLGQTDEALVECRRLDANLSVFNQQYDQKNVYKEDAFGRYLSGIIYESAGNLDDAFIDYMKAYKVYVQDYSINYGTMPPVSLKEDLIRLADKTGRMEEVDRLIGDTGKIGWQKYNDIKGFGKLVFINFNGKAPVKDETRIHVPTPRGPISIAFPRYVIRKPPCRSSALVAQSRGKAITENAELVEDINGIAVKNLDDRKGRVIAKTIARAATKQAAIDAATSNVKNKEDRQIAKILLNLANTAVERADTRSWRTLPGEIYMTRMYLPEGHYTIKVKQCGRTNRVEDSLSIEAGKTRFVLYNSLY